MLTSFFLSLEKEWERRNDVEIKRRLGSKHWNLSEQHFLLRNSFCLFFDIFIFMFLVGFAVFVLFCSLVSIGWLEGGMSINGLSLS